MKCRITHIGTATLLLEIGPMRLLTDPAFDPPGRNYNFGFGTYSTKLTAPSISPDAIGDIDAWRVKRWVGQEAHWADLKQQGGGADMRDATLHVRMASSYLLRWRSVATTVLRNNIATVMGPTPPGTGVIHPAT